MLIISLYFIILWKLKIILFLENLEKQFESCLFDTYKMK